MLLDGWWEGVICVSKDFYKQNTFCTYTISSAIHGAFFVLVKVSNLEL